MNLRFFFSTLALSLVAIAPAFAEGKPQPPADQGFTQMLVMLSIAIAAFYLILWRPEQKRRKQMEDQRNSLKKGDRVTAMGIVGTVASVHEDTIILKMVDGAKVEFLKGAISEVYASGQDQKQESGKRVDLAKHQV